mmetsp:Transcript_78831/g.209305  ORF Transcript_78831/g.209305 Transcript_78831/m.209305 type:complete len:145 (-) Transcript_78831:196-630(-)
MACGKLHSCYNPSSALMRRILDARKVAPPVAYPVIPVTMVQQPAPPAKQQPAKQQPAQQPAQQPREVREARGRQRDDGTQPALAKPAAPRREGSSRLAAQTAALRNSNNNNNSNDSPFDEAVAWLNEELTATGGGSGARGRNGT